MKRVWTLLLAATVLTACSPQGAADVPTKPEPAPRTEAVPPTLKQVESAVTWTIQSLDEPWIEAPYTAAITLPHRFRISFSGPVDHRFVEGAVIRNLGAPYRLAVTTPDDQTMDVTILEGPYSGPYHYAPLTPAGGKDKEGALLAAPAEERLLLSVRPATVISRWRPGGSVQEVIRLTEPLDLLSVSADGTRFALRREALPQAGGIPPVGPPRGIGHWLDAEAGQLGQVEGATFWLTPHWLPDNSLLMGGTMGLTLVLPSGQQRSLVTDQRVVHFAVDPAGERAAILLAGPIDAPGALRIVDLETGKRTEYPDAFTPAYSPNGVPRGVALWSPDGRTLVYTSATEAYGEVELVAFTPASGARRVVLAAAGRPVSWAPDSAYLYVHDVGVLAMPEGRLVLAAHGAGGFSPRGDLLFAGGVGLVTVSDWEPLRTWDGLFRHAVWSPDGAHLALADGGPQVDLYTADGRLAMRVDLPDGADREEAPAWSPDGRFVALGGQRLVDTDLYRVADLPAEHGRPVGWSTDGFLYIGWGRGYGDTAWWRPNW